MKNWILGILVLIVSLSACDNTLDINAPWKETPVVFAVIDLGQDSQIIRVQKTYQNDISRSTNEVAQIADSLYMKNISVRIISNNNPNVYRDLVRLAPRKDSGFFSNKDSSYWGSYMPNWFAAGVKYQLKIHSYETGNDYVGFTDMVGKATINTLSTIDLVSTSFLLFTYRIENIGSSNTALLDMMVRLYYNEVSLANPQDTVVKYVDYYVKKNAAFSTFASATFSQGIKKADFLSQVKSSIKPDPTVKRTFKSFNYVVIGYNNDYRDMLITNAPSGSIIPKFGEYTNINNGIGIFASRTLTERAQPLNTPSVNELNTYILNP
jgi:hypothetical protein